MISFLMRGRKTRRAVAMRAWIGFVMIAIGLAFLIFHWRDSVLRNAGSNQSVSTVVVPN